jgi:hypothetical protein
MKKILTVILLLFAVNVYADTLTLQNTENLPAPANVATKIKWYNVDISADKVITVKFKWRDSAGREIGDFRYFACTNWKQENGDPALNAQCTATGVPYACCTGNQIGICECWSETMGFDIRTQDVGTKMGAGLKELIRRQFVRSELSSGNDATID